MAQHSGFFNALENETGYDKKYNAYDYTGNMGAIISTGVRRSGDDDLKVTASGLNVSVNSGRAWINGHWYYLDVPTVIETITPPVTLSRIDGVFLQLDTSLSSRYIQLVYKTGTPASTPTAPTCTREGDIYEIMIASIAVSAGASSVTVNDTRGDKTVCGWITSPVGYDDYFESLDNQFNEWFGNVKDTLASVTMFKQYTWSTTLNSASDSVTFSIAQYDPTGTDIIQVYVNGLLEIPTADYTLSNVTVNFTAEKTAGTKIVVICYKSIDGTGLGDISEELTELEDRVDALGDVGDYYYFASGSNDNSALSTLVQTFLNGSTTDGASMTLHVVGDSFGVSTASGGSGTSASPYRWIDLSATSATNRKVKLDFGNCAKITATPTASTYNRLIYCDNAEVVIEGLTAYIGNGSASTLDVKGVSGKVTLRDCDITVEGSTSSDIVCCMSSGTADNCNLKAVNGTGNASAVGIASGAMVDIIGGKLNGYTSNNSAWACGVYDGGYSSAKCAIFGADISTGTETGKYQTTSIKASAGYISAFGMRATLTPVTTGATANIYGTIPA